MTGKIVYDTTQTSLLFGGWLRRWNKYTPTRGFEKTVRALANTHESFTIAVRKDALFRRGRIEHSEYCAKALYYMGIKEIEVPAGMDEKTIEGMLEVLWGERHSDAWRGLEAMGIDRVEINPRSSLFDFFKNCLAADQEREDCIKMIRITLANAADAGSGKKEKHEELDVSLILKILSELMNKLDAAERERGRKLSLFFDLFHEEVFARPSEILLAEKNLKTKFIKSLSLRRKLSLYEQIRDAQLALSREARNHYLSFWGEMDKAVGKGLEHLIQALPCLQPGMDGHLLAVVKAAKETREKLLLLLLLEDDRMGEKAL